MLEWLAIAGRVLMSLVIFAIGLYLANVAYAALTRFDRQKSRFFAQTVRFTIITLVTAIALYQISTSNGFVDLVLGWAKADAQNVRGNISLGGTNVAVGGGGYVTGIYLHPLQKDLIYIKTDIGGFYRWNPGDSRWVPITDHFPMEKSRYYGGESLAFDPNNPKIVYIAAGDHLWNERGSIFKSTDQGATWTKLNLDLAMGGNEHKRWVGERLAVSPSNSRIIFFGSRRDGLWKSSDAGASWAKVTSFPGKLKKDLGIVSIVFDKNQSDLVYANAYGDGIYRSTDMGVTWSKIPESPKKANRMAVASNRTLYVTTSEPAGVSKYVNGAWRSITPDGNDDEVFNGLSVNPRSPDEVLVSTGEKAYSKIYRSSDGGATWKYLKRSLNNTVPWWDGIMLKQPWLAAIEFDPNVAGRVWLTDWYGVWRTEDTKTNPVVWTNYVRGHEEVVVFSLVSPPSGSLLLSGVADVDGFKHDQGVDTYPSQKFNGVSFQDTYSIAYCETDPLRMVRVGGNRWNSKFSGATSKDGGKTWQKFASFPEDEMPMRVAMSATNPNLFVVSISEGQAIRTTNSGASWEKVSGLPEGPSGPWQWSQSLAADTVEGNTFYYYWNDNLYRSTDGGASFSVVHTPLVGENKWHSLKAMPGVKGEVWAGFDKKGLYRSTDSGKTFSKIDKVERAYLFAFGKPRSGSTTPAVYLFGEIAGKDEGIFRSLDRGKTWELISDPKKPIGRVPNVMEASKQKFGLVFVGTNGRGIYYGTR